METTAHHLTDLVADLREGEVVDEIQRRLSAGQDPMQIIDECRQGILQVGQRYEQGQYYISGLIMAGEIMRQASGLLFPVLQQSITKQHAGRILLGTVYGDIHYIGKNIFKILLQCSGFTVQDAGEDVPPSALCEQMSVFRPHVIGLSCLLTVCFDSIRDTILELRKEASQLHPVPYIIIGGMVDEKVSRFAGADGWTTNAVEGVQLCQGLVNNSEKKQAVV
jgi:methanogenic corrinoid protein MtbC1